MVAIRHSLMKRIALPLLILALSSAGAGAGDAINIDDHRIAIKGYDTVAYFTEGKPTKGKPEFSVTWRDARWLFASAENRDTFKADPEKYSPRYGGFCALAVAAGQRADVDPRMWTIVAGRLYLNYDEKYRNQWRQHMAENIAKANDHWAAMN